MTILIIIGAIFVALWLSSTVENRAEEEYQKGVDEFHLEMLKIHGDDYYKDIVKARQDERERNIRRRR